MKGRRDEALFSRNGYQIFWGSIWGDSDIRRSAKCEGLEKTISLFWIMFSLFFQICDIFDPNDVISCQKLAMHFDKFQVHKFEKSQKLLNDSKYYGSNSQYVVETFHSKRLRIVRKRQGTGLETCPPPGADLPPTDFEKIGGQIFPKSAPSIYRKNTV